MTEHQIQAAFIQWVRLAEKMDVRLRLLFAVPNGGKRNAITGAILKKEGVKSGIPDIVLPIAEKGFNGLAIEFKTPKTGRISEAQHEYRDLLVKYGWFVTICTDAEAAIKTVKDYLR